MKYSSDYESYYFVNPVNTKGVMGKGLAKQFKKHCPSHFALYKLACELYKLRIGKTLFDHDNKIIALPTKDHWKEKSNINNIELALSDLLIKIKKYKIKDIVMPMIGTGLGGLSWEQEVLPLIKKMFKNSYLESLTITTWKK